MRHAVNVVVSLALLVCSCGPRSVPAAAHGAPRLVVLLVIDQLPSWMFERDRELFTGGFARLQREGVVVRRAELPYANSFTSPGHASIGTGAPPSVHGVIGNSWFRRAEGKELSADEDAASSVFSTTGELVDDRASGKTLQVTGLAEALRAARPQAKSAAIALKPRGAVFMAGQRPDVAVWFDERAGGMTTSRAYAEAFPAWLAELANRQPVSQFVGQTWEPLDAALLARHTAIADDGPGEGDVAQLGVAFPHRVERTDAIVHTPFADQLVLATAEAAIDALELGADAEPDLLAISLNAHDYVGHVFGPDSWEALDLTLRLDRALGQLFTGLDRRFGASGWSLVLTSDHGATPLVERSPVAGARRIPTGDLVAAIDAALEPILGAGSWVTNISSNQVYLSDVIGADVRPRALAAAQAALRRVPNIADVFRADETQGSCTTRSGLARAVCLALPAGVAGDLFVVATRGSLITNYLTGTHHDAPNDFNREVPVIVRAPGVAPRVIDRASFLQVAPTVAALLRVPPPPAASERSLVP